MKDITILRNQIYGLIFMTLGLIIIITDSVILIKLSAIFIFGFGAGIFPLFKTLKRIGKKS